MVKLTLEFRHVHPPVLLSSRPSTSAKAYSRRCSPEHHGTAYFPAHHSRSAVCSGGIELLFDKQKELDVDVPCKRVSGKVRPGPFLRCHIILAAQPSSSGRAATVHQEQTIGSAPVQFAPASASIFIYAAIWRRQCCHLRIGCLSRG